MRRAARVDENHGLVVEAFRAAGCSVTSLAAVGAGVPDLLVGIYGRTLLVEVKNGNKAPSARKLTDHQRGWHAGWRGGSVAIVDSPDAALRLVDAVRRAESGEGWQGGT